ASRRSRISSRCGQARRFSEAYSGTWTPATFAKSTSESRSALFGQHTVPTSAFTLALANAAGSRSGSNYLRSATTRPTPRRPPRHPRDLHGVRSRPAAPADRMDPDRAVDDEGGWTGASGRHAGSWPAHRDRAGPDRTQLQRDVHRRAPGLPQLSAQLAPRRLRPRSEPAFGRRAEGAGLGLQQDPHGAGAGRLSGLPRRPA